jgi:hypothetical protein
MPSSTFGFRWEKLGFASVGWFLAFWSTLWFPPCAWGDDAAVREAFLKHYQQHAASLQNAYENAHVEYTSTSLHGNDKAQIMTVEGKYNLGNYLLTGQSKIVETPGDQDGALGGKVIECHNPDYSFFLARKDDRYVITSLELHATTSNHTLCRLCVPFADPDRRKTFLEIAQDEATEFIAFKDCVWQDKPMKELKVEFPRIHPVSQKQIKVLVSYYFSPQDRWVCCGRRFHPRTDPIYVEEIYFYEPKDGEDFPFLKRLEKWIRDRRDPEKSICRVKTEISTYRRASLPFPDSDFRLTAFGLPEPPSSEEARPRRWYLWLGLAGITCLVLGVSFRWRRRSRIDKG